MPRTGQDVTKQHRGPKNAKSKITRNGRTQLGGIYVPHRLHNESIELTRLRGSAHFQRYGASVPAFFCFCEIVKSIGYVRRSRLDVKSQHRRSQEIEQEQERGRPYEGRM